MQKDDEETNEMFRILTANDVHSLNMRRIACAVR